jgi:hypothetical protein
MQLMRPEIFHGLKDDLTSMSFWDAWAVSQPEDYSSEQTLADLLHNGWQHAVAIARSRADRQVKQTAGEPGLRPEIGMPFHRALDNFSGQQCLHKQDKIYALIGLLDADGKSMIDSNYHIDLHEVFVQAAAAGLVSRWKQDSGSHARLTPDLNDRMFCSTTSLILGLSDRYLESEVMKAFKIAISYMDAKQLWPTPPPTSDIGNAAIDGRSTTFLTSDGSPTTDTMPAMLESHIPSFHEAFEDFRQRFAEIDREFAHVDLVRLKITIAGIQSKQRVAKRIMNIPRIEALLRSIETYSKDIEKILGEENIIAYVWVSLQFCDFLICSITDRPIQRVL